jgi:hypothetical protein
MGDRTHCQSGTDMTTTTTIIITTRTTHDRSRIQEQ